MIPCHKGSKDFPYASGTPRPVLGSLQTPGKDPRGARGPPDSEVGWEFRFRWASVAYTAQVSPQDPQDPQRSDRGQCSLREQGRDQRVESLA